MRKYRSAVFWMIALAFTGGWAQLVKVELNPRLSFAKPRVPQGGSVAGRLVFQVPKPYHVNANPASEEYLIPTTFTPDRSLHYQIKDIRYPAPQERTFIFSGNKPLKVYEGKVSISFRLVLSKKAPLGKLKITGKLRYQACDEQSCYPPQTKAVMGTIEVVSKRAAGSDLLIESGSPGLTEQVSSSVASTTQPKDFAHWIEDQFKKGRWFLFFALLFVGGLGLNLTPCVFPLIPITLGFFGMQAQGRRGRRIGLTALYALSMAATYAFLGTLAAVLGKQFGFQFQNPWFVWGLVILLGVLALSMFDLYKLQLPPSLMRYVGGRTGWVGALLMGLLAGVAAAPCIGPVIAALIPIVAGLGNPWIGFTFFLALGLGLGLPYFVLGLFLESGQGRLPRAGGWLVVVERIFGVLLIGTAIYFTRSVLPESLYNWLWAAFFLFFTFYFLVIARRESAERTTLRLNQALGGLMLALSLYSLYSLLLVPRLTLSASNNQVPSHLIWIPYSKQRLQEAIRQGKPVLIDFDAQWCQACRELEEKTYADPQVVQEAERFVRLKLDSTRETPEAEAAHREHQVVGLPTVIFIDSSGRERRDLRLTTFEPPDQFLKRLKQVQ